LRYKNFFMQNSKFKIGGKVPPEKYVGGLESCHPPLSATYDHTLLDFLHRSRKRYIFFHIKASKVGMVPCI